MSKRKFNPTIPNGWVPYTGGFKVAGIGARRDFTKVAFENNLTPKIDLKHQPDNQHDSNAIMVFVPKIMRILWLFDYSTDFHIGYLPADLAEVLVHYNLNKIVRARVNALYTDDNNYVNAVIIDLIGPSKYIDDEVRNAISECEI